MRPPLILPLLFFLFLTVEVTAQDANYWNSGYGPGGFLTPGAVIASNRDSGVYFYNPALLALSHKNSASITGNIYQYELIRVRDGVGKGLTLSSPSGSIIPLMAAGTIAINGKKPFVIGYALIRNPVSSFQATQRKDAHLNVLRDSYSPGPEYYVGQFSGGNFITETSAQLSVGIRLNEHLTAGFSMEGHVRRQDISLDFSSRALYNSGSDTLFPPVASVSENYLATYTHIGLRFKGGLSYNNNRHHLGLLLTAPLLHVLGRGTIYADNLVSNLKLQDDVSVNFLANTRQTGLNARWKTPFSLAFGYAYDHSSSGQLYFSVEYFTKVGDYNIITPRNDYFIRPDTGNNNSTTASLLKLKDANKAVVNFSVGLSWAFRRAVTGYFSFRTDFSYADEKRFRDEQGLEANTTHWNNWHLQLGVNVKKRKFNLRPGLLLSYGVTHKYMQPFNFDNANENNILSGDPHAVKASRFAAGLLFSYIHNL